MPNIVSQEITAAGIKIVASNGKSVTITRGQIVAQFVAAAGTAAQKKTAAIAWISSHVEATLGTEMVAASRITQDIDTATGAHTNLEITDVIHG